MCCSELESAAEYKLSCADGTGAGRDLVLGGLLLLLEKVLHPAGVRSVAAAAAAPLHPLGQSKGPIE